MKLRRLVARDATAYRALMLDAYAAHPYAFTATAPERVHLPLAWWEGRLNADAQEAVFGAYLDERLAGVVGVQFNVRPKTRHKAWLFGMAVDARCQGKGAGAALLAHALDFAGARPGVALIQLTVTEGNARAQGLYQRAGFLQFGVEPFAVFDQDGYKGKIHMWRPLPGALGSALAEGPQP